jgi:PadR family transcriptional regulator, regulatory protein PadR
MLSRELVAASAEPMVLALLAHGESYGYAILGEIERLSGERIQWSEGMLYPVLHRLEEEGQIRSRWKTAENGRRRKYYSLAPRGRTSLAELKKQWLTVHETLTLLWELPHA